MTSPRIIAETEHLLVLDKPAGLIVHGDGRTEEPSLAEWVAERYPQVAGVGEPWVSPQGEAVPVSGIVHRLDRTTTGVVIAAKDAETFAYLKGEFRARCVEKTYLAYVYGHMVEDAGTVVAEIARSAEKPRRWYARPVAPDDRRAAVTHWRVLGRGTDAATGEPVSLVEPHPQTGRTHQLRVHMAYIGHPMVADHLYAQGREPLLGFVRTALHASEISIEWEGRRRGFASPPPTDFLRAAELFHK